MKTRKKAWFLGVMLVLMFFAELVQAQFTLAADDASHYSSWTDESNEGYNFSGWTFGGNATSARTGIASSTNNGGSSSINVSGDSFYLLDSDDSGNYIDVFRFLASDLEVGETFSIEMDVNFRSGFKGIRVRDTDDASAIFRFEVGNPGSGDDYIVYDAVTGNGSIGNSYSNDTQFKIELEQTSSSGGNWTITRSGGVSDSDTGLYSGKVSSMQLYTTGAGSGAEQAIYYNNLNVTSESASVDITSAAGYRLLSSPVAGSVSLLLEPIWTQGATSGADTDSGDSNVFTWDNSFTDTSNSNWTGLTDLTSDLTAGKGILVYVFADDDFDGTDDAFPKTLSVTGTENSEGTSPVLNSNADGWTLVGNPFATTIDFDIVSRTDLTNVAYVWDPALSTWKSWSVSGQSGDISDGLIVPFQGFFVQNASTIISEDITFNSASKSSGGTFSGKISNERFLVRLELSGNGLKNSGWLTFSESGSELKKVEGDALELEPLSQNYIQLGFQKAGEVFDIVHLPDNREEFTIPVVISASVNGEYMIKATDFEIPSEYQLTFHDYVHGISEVIDKEFNYSFELNAAKNKIESILDIPKGPIAVQTSEEHRFAITFSPVSIANENSVKPSEISLDQNYPNPFNPATTINYSVAEAGNVTITVYNLMGQRVAELLNETKTAGEYTVSWNAFDAASGMYYYRLVSGSQSITRKMTLIK